MSARESTGFMNMCIRAAEAGDLDSMWAVVQTIRADGDAPPFFAGFDKETFRSHWFGSQASYVAVREGEVLGMYKLGANYPGTGWHFASATYLVSPHGKGLGIGHSLVAHSIGHASCDGSLAMQFNYVVSNLATAVMFDEEKGFSIVGTQYRNST
ncbi:GNAT family N-acetyltransferase [Massilia endophytica]|uniref:GNAT family N-acetyltransferase n=1 Tax=Massilia endophytica TaxID=2899220 RepID=UPI001E5E593E|nr:GNAT family N-acetyltransferase [Massilia endophytica]UGQ44577.1 GNAT family N-acetyltransferase [Massilia endophytica]